MFNQKWYLLYFLVFRFQDIGGKIELSVDQPNLKSPEGKIILKVILKSLMNYLKTVQLPG